MNEFSFFFHGVHLKKRDNVSHEGINAMSRVLIIEDEVKLLDSLRRGLSHEGYDVTTADTGEEGYYLATTESFDAILLDLMLPGRDGMRVLSDPQAIGPSGIG